MKYTSEAKRIFDEEIKGLQLVQSRLSGDFDRAVDLILASTGKVVVAGIGKSGIIGHKIAATLASTGTSAVYLNAGEALHGDLGMVSRQDVVLMLSKSAATIELSQMLPSIREIGAKIIGIFGCDSTALAQACDVVLDTKINREACPLGLAPMTSSTVALVMGDALATALIRARGFGPEHFAVYHPGGSLGRRLLLRVRDVMHADPRSVPVVSPGMPLRDALGKMSAANLGGVVIAEGKKVVGVFTDGDLRRQILKGCSLEAPMSEVMTKDPVCVLATLRLGEALDLMEQTNRKIYFVPVVDDAGNFCGALRMHDVVAN
jgi:arabinose-5-phosphate isomerase